MDRAPGHDRAVAGDDARMCRWPRILTRGLVSPMGKNCGLLTRAALAGWSFRDLKRTAGFTAPGESRCTIRQEEFAALFHGRRLADQSRAAQPSLLAGVGNIYADESLFRAGIRPRRRWAADQGRAGTAAAGLAPSFSSTPSGWGALRSRITWMPKGCAAFSSWNIASTSARANPAGSASI